MKRVFLITCAILATMLTLQAQNYLGVQLGYARPITRLNAPIMNTDKSLNASAYNGFKVGVVYDATIVKGFGVTMGVNYTFGANKTDKVSATSIGLYPQKFSRGQYHQIE